MAIGNDNSPPHRPQYQHDPGQGMVAISYGGGDQDLSAYNVRGIHINTAGTLAVVMLDGSSATLTVNAGACYAYRIRQVTQSGSSGAAGYVIV